MAIGNKIAGALTSFFGGKEEEEDAVSAAPLSVMAASPRTTPEGVVDYGQMKLLLQQQIERLRNERPSKTDEFLAFASGLGRPTKTGSFGESLGYANEALAKQSAESAKARAARQEMMLKYGIDLATLGVEEQKNLLAVKEKTTAAALKAATPISIQNYDDVLVGVFMNPETSTPYYKKVNEGEYPGVPVTSAAPGATAPPVRAATPGAPGDRVLPVPGVAKVPPARDAVAPAPGAPTKLPPSTAFANQANVDGSKFEGGRAGLKFDIGPFGKITLSAGQEPPPRIIGPEGNPQVWNPVKQDYVDVPGTERATLEADAREIAKNLGVPYMPPSTPAGIRPAVRDAILKKQQLDADATLVKIDEQAKQSAAAFNVARDFLSMNERTGTGPSIAAIPKILRGSDLQGMDALTSKAAISVDRLPGPQSNYDAVGLRNQVMSIDKDFRTNSAIGRRIEMYNQLNNEYREFATAWVTSNHGTANMDATWARYLKDNPPFDPKRRAEAVFNETRTPWQEWSRKTYYGKDTSAPETTSGVTRYKFVDGKLVPQ